MPSDLRADCARCLGLCCVALPLTRSADFAIDKPAGVPCRHLATDSRCRIHDRLRPAGFPGCTVFDCFGAGQRVVQTVFPGRDWRTGPDAARPMFAAFAGLRALHEVLWHLGEALTWPAAAPLHAELQRAVEATERLAERITEAPDVDAHRAGVAPLLRRAGDLVRGPGGPDRAGADLAGRDLRRTDLRRTTLRGALLIGADLRGAELAHTDLLGADLRGADLRGADLATALYLTQPQVTAARGDAATRLPPRLDRPGHWPGHWPG
jgi:hypothetical protein